MSLIEVEELRKTFSIAVRRAGALGAVRSLLALSVQLGDKPFLMGETPCGLDATAFGALAGILTPFFESPLRQRTEQFTNLTAYVDRMMLLHYPEFAWAPVQQEQAA